MNPFDLYLIKIFLLILAVIFLTIVLSYLALLIRFCPKNCRLILVRSATDIIVFGPGWVFLKPHRERLLKIDIRVQQCEVQAPLSPPVRVLYSFKIIDVQKSATAALQHAERVLEQSNISDKQKEVIRYSREYNSLTENTISLTKSLVALSYIKFARELKAELDDLFIDKGLQLIDISFLLDNDSGK